MNINASVYRNRHPSFSTCAVRPPTGRANGMNSSIRLLVQVGNFSNVSLILLCQISMETRHTRREACIAEPLLKLAQRHPLPKPCSGIWSPKQSGIQFEKSYDCHNSSP